MHVELLIPDLIAPSAESSSGLALPALQRLLGRGIRRVEPPISLEDWLSRAADLPGDGPHALATISLLGDGGEPGGYSGENAESGAWLRADPVHLRMERERMILDEIAAASLTHDDAAELVTTLNAHFTADGMRFSAANHRKWYVRMDRASDVVLIPLSAAGGRGVDELRPQGPDAMAWQRIANEVQMLLHEHPVNTAREARGEAAINGVWFWGAGALPAPAQWRFTDTWSDEAMARGMALLANTRAATRPQSAAQFLDLVADNPEHGAGEGGGAGRHLLVLDSLRTAARERGIDAWRAALEDCERNWFAPLLAALKQDRIGMLSLHALSPHCSLSAEIIAGDLVKFWRRAKPLAYYSELRP